MASDGGLGEELVIGVDEINETLIILPRAVLEHLRDLAGALSSQTWGELRESTSSETYAEVLGQAGYGSAEEFLAKLEVGRPVSGAREEALRVFMEKQGEDLPSDNTPFRPDDIPSYADGDFPPSPQLLMMDHVPVDVIEQYGRLNDTNFNGTFLHLEPSDRAPIISVLEADGYKCVPDQDLVESVLIR